MSFIKRIPTLAVLLIVLALFSLNLKSSGSPDFFIWSWLRLGSLLILLVVAVYFFISLFKPSFLKLNNYLTYLFLVVLIGLEVFIRFRLEVIPDAMLTYLPKAVRQKQALARGFFEKEILTGEGLLYHYQSYQILPKYPYLKIDEFGYRNSEKLSNQVDIVILGDSLIIAKGAEKDLGDLFRQYGYSAINLGMDGYSPQQYRDAYKKYIVTKNISHNFVLIFLFIGNDIGEAIQYEKIKKSGGDYLNYLVEEKDRHLKFLPWTINIARAIPFYIFNIFKDRDEFIYVDLPYKTIKTFKNWQWNQVAKETELGWQAIQEAVAEINFLAKENGAVPIIFLISDPSRFYSQFNDYFKKYDKSYAELVDLISNYFKKENVLFVDLTNLLTEEIKKDFIFLSDTDVHFNTLGIEKLFEIIKDYLKAPED